MFTRARVDTGVKSATISAESFTRALTHHQAAGRIRDFRLTDIGWYVVFRNGEAGWVRTGREAWWVAQALASAELAER